MSPKAKGCSVCSRPIGSENFNLCKNCWLAGKLLDYKPDLIKKLYLYFGGKGKKIKRKGAKISGRNEKLRQLIKSQRADANDRNIRFENAISK